MKKIIISMCYLAAMMCSSAYAEVGARHEEKSGGFSYQAPKDWQFREFPGMKYQIAFGPVSGSFGSNINVVDEAYDETFNESLKTFEVVKRL